MQPANPRSYALNQSPEAAPGRVALSRSSGFWRRALGFLGPGFLVAVGYMDPGNWATDLAGGSRYGYTLLFVIMLSNLFAILLQSLALRLGIASGRDLAQACRECYSRPAAIALWLLAELAIIACDLAEVLGSAIALHLLFRLPLALGVLITGADVLLLLLLQNRGFRRLESLVITLIATISVLFAVELFLSRPEWSAVARDLFVPHAALVTDHAMLYLGISILGATVMPHNLYLHSAIVQTRAYPRTPEGRRQAIRFANLDSAVALTLALLVNAAILIVAAAVFHRGGHFEVAGIEEAYRLLSPMLGVGAAGTLFAVALLASGQNSTLTGTLAGQIVMEGFLKLRMRPWLRRLMTRLLAIAPAFVVVLLFGERGTATLLILSQVVLSMQLSFAVFPLVQLTGRRSLMGPLVNGPWLRSLGLAAACLIAGLNAWLLVAIVRGW